MLVVPGQTYAVMSWVKAGFTSPAISAVFDSVLQLQLRPAGGSSISVTNTDTAWHSLGGSFVAPANAAYLMVGLWCGNNTCSSTKPLYWDDISVK